MKNQHSALTLKVAGILYTSQTQSMKVHANAVKKATAIIDKFKDLSGADLDAAAVVAALIFASAPPSGDDISTPVEETRNLIKAMK